MLPHMHMDTCRHKCTLRYSVKYTNIHSTPTDPHKHTERHINTHIGTNINTHKQTETYTNTHTNTDTQTKIHKHRYTPMGL